MVIVRYVGRPFADVPTALKKSMDHLRPLVADRRRNMQLYGKDYPGKPVGPLIV